MSTADAVCDIILCDLMTMNGAVRRYLPLPGSLASCWSLSSCDLHPEGERDHAAADGKQPFHELGRLAVTELGGERGLHVGHCQFAHVVCIQVLDTTQVISGDPANLPEQGEFISSAGGECDFLDLGRSQTNRFT